jgi:hypothetical protein
MDAPAPTWLTTDLNLLVSDVAQLRQHLAWLREDLAFQSPTMSAHAQAAAQLARELDATSLALGELARALGWGANRAAP